MWDFPLFPKQGSSFASQVDAIYAALWLTSGFFMVLIATLLVVFAIRFHHSQKRDRKLAEHKTALLEAVLIGGPTLIALGIFFWAAAVFFHTQQAPDDAMEVYVVAKQWMWKVQHPGGQREINALHLPVGRAVKLTMTSQDVIHSFYVPAFRVKQDVLPGRYTTLWFQPTEVGEYHLFCAEYCGLEHSRMIGKIVVMSPSDYEAWLGPGGAGPLGEAGTLSSAGGQVFAHLACNNCHVADSALRAPRLQGLFGSQVKLASGQTVIADEGYIRESVLDPNAKIVAGYPSPSLMPTFKSQISEDQLIELIEYIKLLSAAGMVGDERQPPAPGVELTPAPTPANREESNQP
ncbi:MAG: cytochrome c oxidase subunit II [Phycisphaeraceae bacterium]